MLFSLLATPLLAMTPKQIANIQRCYEAGYPYGFGKTMAAICYHESRAGLYKINAASGDYGLTQINIKTALTRLDRKNNWHNVQRTITELVENDELAITLAVQELSYWRHKRGRTWKAAVNSYNQGTHFDNWDYYKKIVKEMRYLEKLGLIK
jgi:hypothetical protein